MKRFTVAVLVLAGVLFMSGCGGTGDALDAADGIYDGYSGE